MSGSRCWSRTTWHHLSAKTWWQADGSEIIAFSRVTQISLLRLLTTAAAMNNKPLTMPEAWDAYDFYPNFFFFVTQ